MIVNQNVDHNVVTPTQQTIPKVVNRSSRFTIMREWTIITFIVLLPFIVFWALFTPNAPDRLIFTGDVLVGAYPTRVFIHELLTSGTFPLWNSYQLGGMPLMADAQVAIFYLPNLLLSAVFWNKEISYVAFEGLIVLHYAFGSLMMYGYLRHLKLSVWASLIGAIAFEFNGFFIGHRGHYSMLSVVIWVPGIMWMLDVAWQKVQFRQKLFWGCIATLFISQMILGGHPQLTLYCTLFIFVYALHQFAINYREYTAVTRFWHSQLFQNIIIFGISGLLSGLIASISIWPTWELLQRSIRNEPAYAFAAQFPLMPRNLINLFVPEFLNWSGTEFRIYGGILTLILAMIALFISKRQHEKQSFFFFTLIVATILSFGGFTSLLGIIYRFVPGFSLVRVSARIFYFSNISLAVLAAFGAEYLIRHIPEDEKERLKAWLFNTRWVFVFLSVIGVGLYFMLMWNYTPVDEGFYFHDSLFALQSPEDRFAFLTQVTNQFGMFVIFLALSIGIIWLRASKRIRTIHFIMAAFVIMILDLSSVSTQHDAALVADLDKVALEGFDVRELEDWELRDQQQLIEFVSQLPDTVRIDNSAEVLPDNYSQIWGASFATGYNVLDIKERFELRNQWPYLEANQQWSLFNVQYVITPADDDEPPQPDAALILANSRGKIWQVGDGKQFVHFNTQVRVVEGGKTINGFLSTAVSPFEQVAVTAVNQNSINYLAQAWPELHGENSFLIGNTGVESPVSISLLGGGQQKYSAILINGKSVTPESRGIILAVIHPETGVLFDAQSFDTFQSEAESSQMTHFINAVPSGYIVTAVTYDEGLSRLTFETQDALRTIGAQIPVAGQAGLIYGVIGVKGSAPGTAVEQLSDQPIMLDIGLGKHEGENTADFESHIVTYSQDEIRLLVNNNQKGLLTLSETIYPGWKAYINGAQTDILRANGIFRSIIVPPASDSAPNEIIFVFQPDSIRQSGIVSLSTIMLVVILIMAIPLWDKLFGYRTVAPLNQQNEPSTI